MKAELGKAPAPSSPAAPVATLRERRQTFAVPVTSLGVLALSLVLHGFIAKVVTPWLVIHFIALGLAVLASVYLWATAPR